MTVDWGSALKVWWSAAWRGALYGFGGGFILGFAGGVIAALMHEPEKAALYGNVGGLLAAIPASILAFKQALSRHLPMLAQLAAQQAVPLDVPVFARSGRG